MTRELPPEPIPAFSCKPGCHACCGPVPFTGPERDRASALRPLIRWEPFEGGSWIPSAALESLRCPFLSAEGCGIYAARPMICRLFGVVDHPRMACPEGCGPRRKISDAAARRLLAAAA